jgi:hypothetical protein
MSLNLVTLSCQHLLMCTGYYRYEALHPDFSGQNRAVSG